MKSDREKRKAKMIKSLAQNKEKATLLKSIVKEKETEKEELYKSVQCFASADYVQTDTKIQQITEANELIKKTEAQIRSLEKKIKNTAEDLEYLIKTENIK